MFNIDTAVNRYNGKTRVVTLRSPRWLTPKNLTQQSLNSTDVTRPNQNGIAWGPCCNHREQKDGAVMWVIDGRDSVSAELYVKG